MKKNKFSFRIFGMIVLLSGIGSRAFSQAATTPAADPAKSVNKTNELKYNLNEDGSHFVKFAFTNQVWVRYAQNNPGSAVAGTNKFQREDETFDIGLRRTRLQVIGKVSDRFFFYTQLGQNNFNYISARKTGFFIHDALGEIDINKHLELGAGLTAWTGFSRFSSPGVASIMALDAPLYLQATNDANDQFLRKLSVYAKGKLGKFDYRLILSKPMDYTYSTLYKKSSNIGTDAQFAPNPPKVQTSGYVSYQFKDQESNMTPYQVGTYLGKKTVMNVGAGFQYQQDATWSKVVTDTKTDTVYHNMLLASLDFYYDAPINKEKGNAISVYAVGTYYDFGKNYIRNLGVMNTTDSLVSSAGTFNGTGVNFPMIGTGNSAYVQVGYLSGKLSEKKNIGRLMPYVAVQFSQYQKLDTPMLFVDGGVSLYLDDARSKLTFGVQNRPVYEAKTQLDNTVLYQETKRLNSFILQYQVSI